MARTANRRRWTAVVSTPVGAAAAVAVALLAVLAAVAPILWSADADAIDPAAITQGPSAQHPLGTDNLGRDVLLRVLVATRLSLGLALGATAIGLVVGVLLGAAPAVLGRRVGRLAAAAVNIAVAFPGLLLALFFSVIAGVGATGAVVAVGLALAPAFARLTQTLTASISDRDYVHAARILGVGRIRLLLRHILPNIGEPLVVNATLGAAGSLLAFASLSFLGLGVQPPSYDWGRLLAEGLYNIYLSPLAALAPGAAVVLAGLALNLFGEAAAQVIGRRTPRSRPPTAAAAVNGATAVPDDGHVLSVSNLRVRFPAGARWSEPVRGVSFTIAPGESVGIVGESGSGKSLTALAVSALVRPPGEVTADRLDFAGHALLRTPRRTLDELLGTGMAMVFQDPMSSFNPALRMGRQLAEVAEEHQRLSRRAALTRAVESLRAVRIPGAWQRVRQYPHEFSGGMRQRAMIGMGLMGSPRLLIADEPTTALDVTVQRQILRLLATVRRDTGAALLLISHDIAVVSQVCDRVLVMYAGRIVEDLTVQRLLTGPRHPYTRALVASVPDLGTDRTRPLATIPGRPPEPDRVPPGCAFAQRCPLADARCAAVIPRLLEDGPGSRVACWHPRSTGSDLLPAVDRSNA